MDEGRQVCTSGAVSCGDIAAFVDGELSVERERELEAHIAGCSTCSFELNIQKQLLRGLDDELRNGTDIELPPDFARIVAANAESTVMGLRRSRERSNALFICGGLALFILLSFGVGAVNSLFFEQIAAIFSVIGHVFYDICLGIVVILRTAAAHFRGDVISACLVGAVAVAALFVFKKVLGDRLRI